jgi:hypothetical protein
MVVAASSAACLRAQMRTGDLPDSPGTLLSSPHVASRASVAENLQPTSLVFVQLQTPQPASDAPAQDQIPNQIPAVPSPTPFLQPPVAVRCAGHEARQKWWDLFMPSVSLRCMDKLQTIVDAGPVSPMTPAEKGLLAFHAVADPFNLLTVAGFSAISVAANAHSDYGPGFAGWGRLSGYSLVEDAQLEFTGTFLLPTIFHEDPRYHRMPDAPVRRRIEHALIHGFVSQHDDGSVMPNYATLINYPLSDEISNLYVPGLGTSLPSTTKRVFLGYATEPVGPLLAEFLPDVAKRVHIHIIFAQQILNQLALGSAAPSSSD